MKPFIPPLPPGQVSPAARSELDKVKSRYGFVPNFFGVIAHAPSVLQAYNGLAQALDKGLLAPREREIIAVAVATRTGCTYCLQAHMAAGRKAGLSTAELEKIKLFTADSMRDSALLNLVSSILDTHGAAPEPTIAAARHHGFDDPLLVEIVAQVVLNLLTNIMNRFARTPPDSLRSVAVNVLEGAVARLVQTDRS